MKRKRGGGRGVEFVQDASRSGNWKRIREKYNINCKLKYAIIKRMITNNDGKSIVKNLTNPRTGCPIMLRVHECRTISHANCGPYPRRRLLKCCGLFIEISDIFNAPLNFSILPVRPFSECDLRTSRNISSLLLLEIIFESTSLGLVAFTMKFFESWLQLLRITWR